MASMQTSKVDKISPYDSKACYVMLLNCLNWSQICFNDKNIQSSNKRKKKVKFLKCRC